MKCGTWFTLALTLILTLALSSTSPAVYADSITVNSTTDVSDGDTSSIANLIASPGADGVISLREAMEAAYSNAGADTITFNIPGSGPHTITPLSPLPTLNDFSGGTTIDGYSQPGSVKATETTSATLMIVIDGSSAGATNGFEITQPNNVIMGLVISNFEMDGVYIHGLYGTNNTITGNYIGTDTSGTTAQGNGWYGVDLRDGAQHNTIGGDSPAERNVISGNEGDGIFIRDSNSAYNTVSGNYIGTDATGTATLSNVLGQGISLFGGTHDNMVGGDAPGEGNLISGNNYFGIHIQGSTTMSNTVSGNTIGTDASGTADLGNDSGGIYIYQAANNTIGGTTESERNLISGNGAPALGGNGIFIEGNAMGNVVIGNYIGTDVTGTTDLGNFLNGIFLYDGAQYNVIGGDTAAERNVIAGNDVDGIYLGGSGTMSNTISGNYIGVDASGINDIGNTEYGIRVYNGPQFNIIGGDTAAERNVISGNDQSGVYIYGTDTMSNTISGNYIGTDASGTGYLGNTFDGVELRADAQQNTIGPDNVIAYNERSGVLVFDVDAHGNTITQNSIFANVMGIDLINGANGGIAAPVINTATGSINIVGTACAGCTVEVFENSDNDGEGETYIGSTTATASGDFTLTVASLHKPYLTATATDVVSGTSEFSNPLLARHFIYLPLVLRNP